MVTEIANITAAEGSADAFEKVMREEGLGHLSACPGVIVARFGRGVENPQNFAFIVEWESMEAHAAARSSESFAAFRACFGNLTASGAMEHFDCG